MKKRERVIRLLTHSKTPIGAMEIGGICGFWINPYPTLAALEHDGLIKSKWENPHSDFPRHRVYLINRSP